MDAQSKRKIGLVGYTCLQAHNIAKLIDENAESLGQSILSSGNNYSLALSYNTDVTPGKFNYEITYSLDDGDNEEIVVDEIHSAIEDIILAKSEKHNITLDDIIQGVANISKLKNSYIRYIEKLKNNVTDEVINEFVRYCNKEDKSLELNQLYLNQYSDEPLVELYNAVYMATKFALNSQLRYAFPLHTKEVQSVKNCITFSGEMDISEATYFFDTVRNLCYASKIPFTDTLECINIELHGESPNVYMYTSYPINTPKHTLLLREADLILFCDSDDHIKVSSKEHIESLKLYKSILPSNRTDYILVKDFISPLDPVICDELITSKKNRTFMMYSGSDEISWELDMPDRDAARSEKFFDNSRFGGEAPLTDIKRASDFLDEEIATKYKEEELSPDTGMTFCNFSAVSLLKEVSKTGLNGYNDYTIGGFGDEPAGSTISAKDIQSDTSYLLPYPKKVYAIEKEGSDIEIEFYITDKFSLNDITDDYINNVVLNLQEDRANTEDLIINSDFSELNYSIIEETVDYAKNMYLSKLSTQLDKCNNSRSREDILRRKLIRLLLSTSCQGLFGELQESVADSEFQVPTQGYDDYTISYVQSEIKLSFLTSVYSYMTAKANQFWRQNSLNMLCNKESLEIQDFKQVLDEIL